MVKCLLVSIKRDANAKLLKLFCWTPAKLKRHDDDAHVRSEQDNYRQY